MKGQRIRRISPVGEEKVYGGKDLLKIQVFSSEWKKERVRHDESGDSEDGEDELPCVIGGEREADSIWRGSLSSMGVHSIEKVQRTEKSDCDFQTGPGR